MFGIAILPRGLTENQKEELKSSFIAGEDIETLVQNFNFSKFTIIKNLKKILGENRYKKLLEKKSIKQDDNKYKIDNFKSHSLEKLQLSSTGYQTDDQNNIEEFASQSHFLELTPLDLEIDVESQKDISSIPLTSIKFPKVVFMVVDKNIELETKFLGDYPEWRFLPENDLTRKSIEIFYELKNAKRRCNKDQKVIKVPNPNVFKIAAPILVARGISRIISEDQLISL